MVFEMRVIGIPSDPSVGAGHADAVHAMSDLKRICRRGRISLPSTRPLTAETEKLIDADALGRMKPSRIYSTRRAGAWSTGRRSSNALARRQIRGAALDVTVAEPLPAASPLWAMEHVLISHIPRARPAATRTMCSRSCRRISRGSGAARPSC